MPTIYYRFYDPASMTVPEMNRLEHEAGRELLVIGLSELYSLPCSSIDPGIEVLAEESGKPYLPDHPDICFNITHCKGLVACAFHSSLVGVDAELTGYFPEVLINRVLTAEEQNILISRGTTEPLRQEWFYRFWTLKEAYVKRTGIGVDTDLKAFSFRFDQNEDPYCPLTVSCSDHDVSCFQTMLESGHIISLCTDAPPEKVSLVCR